MLGRTWGMRLFLNWMFAIKDALDAYCARGGEPAHLASAVYLIVRPPGERQAILVRAQWRDSRCRGGIAPSSSGSRARARRPAFALRRRYRQVRPSRVPAR